MTPGIPVLALFAVLFFAGCEQINQQLGVEDPAKKEAKADAEGRAVGSACRQSGRAIEDCYSIYGWMPKASIFAGWREMNDYMQTNNLPVVEPKLPPPASASDWTKARKKPAVPLDGATGEENKAKAETKQAGKEPAKDAAREAAKEAARDSKATKN